MSKIRLENVSKHFPDGTVAVDGISLEVSDREFLVLVGPSGCGKSTTLRLIAGLETLTGGQIHIGGRAVNSLPPRDRDIAMVFQNYALYPHMSVYDNMSFGLRLRYGGGVITRGLRRLLQPGRAAELNRLRCGIDQQVRQTAARLGIERLLNRKPFQLSGGERQRVALGRAIVRNPAAFLFDEPLSNLDAKLRVQMRIELRRLHAELGATIIHVTHDQTEAMTLGDRVAVMEGGRILQTAAPLELYRRPTDLFVARFIGSAPINLCRGSVYQRDDRYWFIGPNLSWCVEPEVMNNNNLPTDSEVILGFRAEDVWMPTDGQDSDIVGDVFAVDQLGDTVLAHLNVGDRNQVEEFVTQNPMEASSSRAFVVRVEGDRAVSVGDRLRLSIRKDKVLWFDHTSGQNLVKDQT